MSADAGSEVGGVVRVTVTLDPADVDLLDRLARLERSNRSAELRSLLEQMRPVLAAAVEAFEGAIRARGELDKAAAQATVDQLEALLPQAEQMQDLYLGALAAMEGREAADPRPSNHGGHTPTPSASPGAS